MPPARSRPAANSGRLIRTETGVNECGALEIEIRGKSDDPLPPQAEQDEELKLLALNSLMQQDEVARAAGHSTDP